MLFRFCDERIKLFNNPIVKQLCFRLPEKSIACLFDCSQGFNMKPIRSLLCAILLSSFAAYGANPPAPTDNRHLEQLPNNQEQIVPTNDDLLRTKQIKLPPKQAEGLDKFTDAQLLAQPQMLENLLTVSLAEQRVLWIERLADLYRKQNPITRDNSLLEWAQAMLHAHNNQVRRAIHDYRVLSGKFPNNTYIRFQLAQLLFRNQEYEAAKGQFEKLRADPNMTPQDIKVFDDFLGAIAKKDKWNFHAGATILHDRNLTDAADVGARVYFPNGSYLEQRQEKETGVGVNLNVHASKTWSLNNNKYVGMSGGVNWKNYFNNKAFNELNMTASPSIGYANANMDWSVSPYITKRLYGGGKGFDSDELRAYSQTIGVRANFVTWFTPKFKHVSSYSYGRERYNPEAQDKRLGGKIHYVGTSITYLPNAKRWFGGGVDLIRRKAGAANESYKRYGGNVFIGQELPKGFVTQTSVSYAKRNHDSTWFGLERDYKELGLSASVWNKGFHFYGITPRLTWQYQKTKSSIPIFSFDKHTAFIELNKSF